VEIFKQHLRNADAMLGRLIATFEAAPHRVVLLFYGDHVPLLKAYADPFPDARTDYVLLELGARARSAQPAVERHRAVHELGLDLMRQILL
jgi:phosphoglycerol transferase MdoB-like AlkP superfamily enzyme